MQTDNAHTDMKVDKDLDDAHESLSYAEHFMGETPWVI